MKKIKSFFFLLVLACTMTSCFNNTGSQTTPQMQFGYLYVNPQFEGDTIVGAKDTLYDHFNDELGLWYLDTLQLGDTVMFPALFTSNVNNLVSINAVFDTTMVDLWFAVDMEDEAIKKALQATSDPKKGLLLFNPMYNFVTFPIYIVPQKAGAHPIKITVTSDSQYPTNSSLFTLPVKND